MNYRHIFHAGNFADVFKHVLLVLFIERLQQKEKGCCFIDTHAGIGLYDLKRKEAQRNPEFLTGIDLLLKQTERPVIFERYLKIIATYNQQSKTHCKIYPGSPCITQQLLREQDKLIVNELHPEDYQQLKSHFRKDPCVHCHQRDAYEFLSAMLPPTPARGLVLIDPPYEKVDEYDRVRRTLIAATKKYPHGVYMLWYPLKTQEDQRAIKRIQRAIACPSQIIELGLPIVADAMTNCGVLLMNPPWGIDKKIQVVRKYLTELFNKF